MPIVKAYAWRPRMTVLRGLYSSAAAWAVGVNDCERLVAAVHVGHRVWQLPTHCGLSLRKSRGRKADSSATRFRFLRNWPAQSVELRPGGSTDLDFNQVGRHELVFLLQARSHLRHGNVGNVGFAHTS